jgi:SP family general alpha glucoside:H+ symporter-like MFS transporter
MEAKVTTEQDVLENIHRQIDNYDDIVAEARDATAAEHSMTLREGLRRYPKAIGWSVLLSTAM